MASLTIYITKKPSRYPPLQREMAKLTDHAVVRVTADGQTPYLHEWVPFMEMQECPLGSAPTWYETYGPGPGRRPAVLSE